MNPLSVSVLALLAGSLPPQAGPPGPPEFPAQRGRELVALARKAMTAYLAVRVTPDAMPIPRSLIGLRSRQETAAVRLRRDGRLVALRIHAGADLCGNVVGAALLAMRSHRLPDRVDQPVLDSLTVEVEVISGLAMVEPAGLARRVTPGLHGLALWRGPDQTPADVPADAMSWVLPATACILGLDAEAMRRAAAARYAPATGGESAPERMGIYATRHFVGLPDGEPFELFRGKDLTRRPLAGGKPIPLAEKIAGYLLANRAEDGGFDQSHTPAALWEQLYAAWSLARLARIKPDAVPDATVDAIISSGIRQCAAQAPDPPQRPAAKAMLALLLTEAGRREHADLRRRLGPEIAQGLADRHAGRKVSGKPVPAEDLLALWALARLGADTPEAALGELGEALAAEAPADSAALLWAARARTAPLPWLPAETQTPSQKAFAIVGSNGLPDERGGLARGDAGPRTFHTALAAAIAAERTGRRRAAGDMTASDVDAAVDAMLAFCRRMIVAPHEAWFARDPASRCGGVRATCEAARVTVLACAAAMDAMLTVAKARPGGG